MLYGLKKSEDFGYTLCSECVYVRMIDYHECGTVGDHCADAEKKFRFPYNSLFVVTRKVNSHLILAHLRVVHG